MNIAIATAPFKFSFEESFGERIQVIGSSPEMFEMLKAKQFDLVIFSGGEDISPSLYGRNNNGSYGINTARDEIEWRIADTCLNLGQKVLGVCRGHQLLNAYCGAKLIQDLPSYGVPHHGNHPIEVIGGEKIFYSMFPAGVNSLHHQGVQAGDGGMYIVAHHKGITEISTYKSFVITTQFHPEFMGKAAVEFFTYIKNWVKKGKQESSQSPAESAMEEYMRIRKMVKKEIGDR